jgi:hypothetical protein
MQWDPFYGRAARGVKEKNTRRKDSDGRGIGARISQAAAAVYAPQTIS